MMTGTQVGFMNPTNLTEAMECANLMANSNLVPKTYQDKPGDILIAGQMGAELGVPWLQALQGICVINGNPSVWGDLAWALVTSHSKFEDSKESYDEDTRTAHCSIKVKGRETWIEQSFSYADACQAGLNTKDTYKKYRRRMLQWRARSWAMRDAIPEALKGLKMAEEQIAIEGVFSEVETDSVGGEKPSTGMDALGKAMIEGPKDDSKHPEGSAEWWAELLRGTTSLAQLEKVGFELRAADKELSDDMRGLYESHHDSLRQPREDSEAIAAALKDADSHVEQEYDEAGATP